MNIYDTWIDATGNSHLLSEMDTSYIKNCVNEIRKAADSWRMETFATLSDIEKEDVNVPLQKAWFVVNALDYLYSFKNELEDRLVETTDVDRIINRIIDARNTH